MGSVPSRPALIGEIPLFADALAAAAANMLKSLGDQLTDAWLGVRELQPRSPLVDLVTEASWLKNPGRCPAEVFAAMVKQMEALLRSWAGYSELSSGKTGRREQVRLLELHRLSRDGLLGQEQGDSSVARFWGMARVLWLGQDMGLRLPVVAAELAQLAQDDTFCPEGWDATDFVSAVEWLIDYPLADNPLHELLRCDEMDLELFFGAVELLSYRGKVGQWRLRLAVETAVVLGPWVEDEILEGLNAAGVSRRDLLLASDVCRRYSAVELLGQRVIRPETFTEIGRRHDLSPSAMNQFKKRLIALLSPQAEVE